MKYPKQIADCIDTICQQGCSSVRDVIKSMEAGDELKETDHLNADEKDTVLRELKHVMSVYDMRNDH